MSPRDSHRFAGSDYLALGISLFLALLAWFVHNMSLTYSSVVQYTIVAQSSIDGHSDISSNSAQIAARCELTGYELLFAELSALGHKSYPVYFAPEYFHHRTGNIYYLDKTGLTRYFHELFGNEAKLENFITDTVYYDFPAMSFKKVPVHATTDITFSSQYMATKPLKIMPDSLLVYGNDSQIKNLERLNTRLILLRDVNSDCFGEVSIESVPGLRTSATKVGYSLPVVRYVEKKMSLDVKMTGAPVWMTFQIVPSTATVTMRLPLRSASFDTNGCFVEIPYDSFLQSRTGTCVGEVQGIPDDVLSLSIEPEVFGCILQSQ